MDTQALHSYARRIIAVLDEIDALKDDLKEIEAEARTMLNCNVKALRKWVNAERRDKIAAVVCEVGDLTEYGTILGHMETFQGGAEKQSGEITDFDEATGEILPDERPAFPGEPAAAPLNDLDAESPAQPAAEPNVNVAPAKGEERTPVDLAANPGQAAPLTMPDIPAFLRRTA